MKFRFALVLVACATLLGVFVGGVNFQPCKNVLKSRPHMRKECCDTEMGRAGKGKMIAEEWCDEFHKVHECPHPKPGEPRTCEHSECKLKAMGILVDGKINYDALTGNHEQFFKDNPDIKTLVDKMVEDCSEERLKDWPEDMCTAQRVEACIMLKTVLNGCTKWKTDDEECKKLAEDTKVCSEALETAKK